MDTVSGTLNYANAGHHPAYIIDSKGGVSSTGDATGTIVGMLDEASYENGSIVLESEHYPVLYTDGIPEACSPDKQFFGDERFTGLLSEYAGKAANEICEHIVDRVIEYRSDELSDDIRLLVLRRNS